MTLNFFIIVICISITSIVVPLVICIRKLKALNNPLLRALFFYLATDFLLELTGFALALNGISNYITQNALTVVEGSAIPYVYFTLFTSKKSKLIIASSYFAFILFAGISFILHKGLFKQDTYVKSFECLFIIFLSLAYFYKLMQESNVSNLSHQYYSWLNIAFFLYFCMAFYFFVFDSVLIKTNIATYYKLYSLLLISNIVYNSALSVGIWKIKKI